MRLIYRTAFTTALLVLIPASIYAQAPSETSRAVAGGGISVPGWTGEVDPGEGRRQSQRRQALPGRGFPPHHHRPRRTTGTPPTKPPATTP